MVVIIDKDAENLVFLSGIGVPIFFILGKGDISFFKKLYGMGVSNGSRA